MLNGKLIKKHSTKEESTTIMTPTNFMIEEVWKIMTPSLIKGLRTMPILKANPQWWMLEIFNEFVPHLPLLIAT